MRRFGIFVCGVLLSVQGFAGQGVTGSKMGRSIKNFLGNQKAVQAVSNWAGKTSLGVSSRNVGKVLGQAAVTAAVSTALLFGAATADADLNKRAAEIGKKVGSAKVVNLGNDTTADIGGRIDGSLTDVKDSETSINVGLYINGKFQRKLTSIGLSGSVFSQNSKRFGDDDYTGKVDYIGRASLVQGIPIGVDSIVTPSLFAEVGAAQFGKVKRQVDATAGPAISMSRELFGKNMEIRVRGGAGVLWEGQYGQGDEAGDKYGDLESDAVMMFGVGVTTGWVSLGDITGAGEGSLANYIPIVPGGKFEFVQYNPLESDRFYEQTRRLNATINIIQGLGVTVEWNKTQDQEAHRKVVASLTYGIF